MKSISTRYGILNGASYVQLYPNGNVKEVTLTLPNEIKTANGNFVPQYLDDGFRRKRVKPVIFHENGSLKNLPLQNTTEVETSMGVIPAELITFYEDGSIRRIFPLDGMLTGFWTEDDEYELSKPLEFNLLTDTIRQKIIAVQFYRSGTIKSLTFWPKDIVAVVTSLGNTEIRIGLSVYPDGRLKSFEPGKPLIVDTPIGKITAFDTKAIGIHSDGTSLTLTETGEIEQLVTSNNMVTVIDKKSEAHIYQPHFKPEMFNLMATELVPLSIRFYNNKVSFNNNPEEEYKISEFRFIVSPLLVRDQAGCSTCDNCTKCNVG